MILPPTPQGGLFMSSVFNKSPLGDLGVALKKAVTGLPEKIRGVRVVVEIRELALLVR